MGKWVLWALAADIGVVGWKSVKAGTFPPPGEFPLILMIFALLYEIADSASGQAAGLAALASFSLPIAAAMDVLGGVQPTKTGPLSKTTPQSAPVAPVGKVA